MQTVQIQRMLDLITLQVSRDILTSVLALVVQMLPSKLGILLVDSEKQELMGEEMAKCIYVPFRHVKIFLHDPKPSAIFLLVPKSPVTLFAENSLFIALFGLFWKIMT